MTPDWAWLLAIVAWFVIGVIVGKTWTWERKP